MLAYFVVLAFSAIFVPRLWKLLPVGFLKRLQARMRFPEVNHLAVVEVHQFVTVSTC